MQKRLRQTLHVLTAAEAESMCRWAEAEGWNPGVHDAETFRASDPEGFLGLDVDGKLAGTISAVRYGIEYAFVGFFIVRPGQRGHLIGPALAEAAMNRIAGIPTGIDGVLENVGKYERLYGFQPSWRNTRYALMTRPDFGTAPGLVPASDVPLEELLAFDSRYFPAGRGTFLNLWLTQPGASSLAARSVDGRLTGYGVIRPCATGWKIGPLFATDPETAEALFIGLCTASKQGPVFLDIPEPNTAARKLASRFGMVASFATARMFRDSPREVDLDGIYGITSFELG